MLDQTKIQTYLQSLTSGLQDSARNGQALGQLLGSLPNLRLVRDLGAVEAGAPAYLLLHGQRLVGFVEVTTQPLEQAVTLARNRQLIALLPNIILTDYVEFRWYVSGQLRSTVRLGDLQSGNLKPARDGADTLTRLLQGFIDQQPTPPIRSVNVLAAALGRLAGELRRLIVYCLTQTAPNRDLLELLADFQTTLTPELTAEDFADELARAITFGMLAARLRHSGQGRSTTFQRRDAYWDMPPTNPLLRRFFDERLGGALDPRIAWLVDVLTDVLARADIVEIMNELRRRERRQDPLNRLRATFWQAYAPDAAQRPALPDAFVHYMIQSLDDLLHKRFRQRLGLAAPNTLIFDPAAGSGTFLYFIVQSIHDTLRQARQLGAWDDYVPDNLLTRLWGYETDIASYTLSHLKLSLQLQELGYTFDRNQRLNLFLNPQLAALPKSTGFLAEEQQVAALPEDFSTHVLLGNPPPETALAHLQAAAQQIGRSGIAALITPASYLDETQAQGLRQELRAAFSDIYILNLLDGSAISFCMKEKDKSGPARLHYAELKGTRSEQLAFLQDNTLSTTPWIELYTPAPQYRFTPQSVDLNEEYAPGWLLTDILTFHIHGQEQDERLIFDKAEARHMAQAQGLSAEAVQPLLYRPFDRRYWINAAGRAAPNLYLIAGYGVGSAVGQPGEAFISASPVDARILADMQGPGVILPLYLSSLGGVASPFAPGKDGRGPNLSIAFIQAMTHTLRLTFVPDGRGDSKNTFGPEDVLHYVYAILHSPAYRQRYADFLRDELPRIPLTANRKLFRALARWGRRLKNLHLLRKSDLWALSTGFVGIGSSVIEAGYPRFTQIMHENGGRVYINDHKYFEGVPKEVWEFQMGGEAVVVQWLQARQGRDLSFEDVLNFQKIVTALQKTIPIMREIDRLIPGWPVV